MDGLIIYSSTDGQTIKICENIKENLSTSHTLEIVSVEKALDINLEKYKIIIIGASIRYGSHSRKILNFVIKNKNILESKKTAFFSVNVVARKAEKNSPHTNPYLIKFLKKSNW